MLGMLLVQLFLKFLLKTKKLFFQEILVIPPRQLLETQKLSMELTMFLLNQRMEPLFTILEIQEEKS
jgi:hypothetical protein